LCFIFYYLEKFYPEITQTTEFKLPLDKKSDCMFSKGFCLTTCSLQKYIANIKETGLHESLLPFSYSSKTTRLLAQFCWY